MPAIITHHLFGEDATRELPEGILESEEELIAFLLGNQGPDPFFSAFSTLPQRAANCHALADRMHERGCVDALWAMRDAVSHLPADDARFGRAFSLGFIGHYALDSTAHPFVYAQQNALIHAGGGLDDAGSEVHAVIESDIDVWTLRELRGLSVADVPTTSFLARTDRVTRVAGALLAQVALQVYDLPVGVGEYAGAVADYEFLYRGIDPAGSPLQLLAARTERLFRRHSYTASLAHHLTADEDCPALNLDRHAWTDPADGTARTESFPDLYHDALGLWGKLAQLFTAGDRAGFELASRGINYNGLPDKS
ncbi:MAG: zinc dependent phospholipase C family protein [Olegusella sp.]|nr:zinc dependent phospholipase C family protein [Olegusella sp.]